MQIEYRVCPECSRAFYAFNGVESLSCPHCGYVLLDRRSGERIKKRANFFLLLKGEKVAAELEDYSEGGMRIVYEGEPLNSRAVVDVNIDELKIHGHARAVWSKKISGAKHSIGLKLL